MVVVLKLSQSAFSQLWVIQIVNLISFVYVFEIRPYQEEFLNKMETFNEIANIICVDLMFSFTGVINQQNEEITIAIRDKVGILFIGLLLATVAVHIAFLIGGQIKTMKQNCTKKALKSKWSQ